MGHKPGPERILHKQFGCRYSLWTACLRAVWLWQDGASWPHGWRTLTWQRKGVCSSLVLHVALGAMITTCLTYPGTVSIWGKHWAQLEANGKVRQKNDDHLAPYAAPWCTTKMQVRRITHTSLLIQGALQQNTTQSSIKLSAQSSKFFCDYSIELSVLLLHSGFCFSLSFIEWSTKDCTSNTNNRCKAWGLSDTQHRSTLYLHFYTTLGHNCFSDCCVTWFIRYLRG